jgi:hypothetical protein
MSKQNDGGPAFPESSSGPYPNGDVIQGRPGMTLRDWFAGQSDGLHPDTTVDYARCFNAAPLPPQDERVDWARWWATADAAYRYIQADAMLKAREQ